MNILIIDDDKSFCEQLKNDFMQYFSHTVSEINFEIFHQRVFELERIPDILFIDIDLSKNESGIDLAVQLRKQYPNLIIIFTSIRDDLIFNTLIVGVFQFIRKQKYETDLKITFSQLKKYIEAHFQKAFLKIKGEKQVVYFRNVSYIMAIGRLLLIHADQDYEISGTILDATRLFTTSNFVQVQRGLIINLQYITHVSYHTVEMFDGKQYQVGRKYREDFQNKYKEYLLKC